MVIRLIFHEVVSISRFGLNFVYKTSILGHSYTVCCIAVFTIGPNEEVKGTNYVNYFADSIRFSKTRICSLCTFKVNDDCTWYIHDWI
ncbi:unnamed protein product [Allacma fusca]|uniref:Uncharacterized protein n=1 Tax=Allacma fusca TaxID=39272 RepID=A0A8J2KN55_9HEXA|nr:unnamed protein product [Allacma fusca]